MDHLKAAGLEPHQRGREQVAGATLHHVLDEGAEPTPHRFPLAARVVHELDIGVGVLELAVGDEPRLRIGDGAARR